MSNVFKVGDVVYHPQWGKVSVHGTQHSDGRYPCVDGKGETFLIYEGVLSFTPWPKPCHERPLKDGLYKIKLEENTNRFLAVKRGGKWFWANGGTASWGGASIVNLKIIDQEFLCDLTK